MKNFRKVLALVLVVATLFSFAAMAGAKTLADYTDAEAVNYDVAVEVLSALEILNGYEDDTFKPTNTISREEMAKMIAVLANAGDDVSALYAAANGFADVEATRWSASYIAYCAHTGIVAGRSAETFDPYGKVTGLETAKMLLVTMGFDAAEQGYVGANWKINVLRDAKNFGLLNGFAAGYDVDAAITREEAANMMLNALQAPVVIGVLSDNIVKITNALYNKEHGIQATLKDAEKYGWIKLYGNVIVADESLTLGEALYNNRLLINPTSDCYGRPGSKWTLTNKKGTKIFEGKFIADAVVASDYTGEIDLNKVLKEEYDLGNYYLTAYVDGKNAGLNFGTHYNKDDDKETLADFAADNIGKGVLVEVYVNDAKTQITVVVINTRIGVVEATVKGSDRFYIKGTGLCFSNKTYGFEQDDVILYWLCGKNATDLHDAQIAVPTTAAITRGEKSNNDDVDSTFTAGGKVYEYAKKWNQGVIGTQQVDASKNDGVTYDIYTDLYGYAIMYAVHEDEVEEFYAYIVEGSGKANHAETLGDGTVVYTAEKTFVDFAAAVKEGTAVDSRLWLATLWDTKDFEQTIGSLVKYTIDDEGRATVAQDGWAEEAGIGAELNAEGDLVLPAGRGSKTIYGNDDTKYLVRTWNYETEAYEYAAYTQDTLPSGFKGYVVNERDFDASIQYFSKLVGTTVGQKAEVLTYVFIDAQFAVKANRALILDSCKSITDAKFINKIGAVDCYEAVVNGTAGYVLLTEALRENSLFVALKEKKHAPILVETELEIVGLMDNGLPVYAMATVERPNVKGPVEFIGGELVNGHVSKDIEDDFFAVVVDPEGNAQVFTDAAKLNDYVETMEAYLHTWLCHKTDKDGKCLCETYVWTKGWGFDDDKNNKLDELYVVIDLECFDYHKTV